eukprot:2411983-Alexandrium_andersonii.AAC.1
MSSPAPSACALTPATCRALHEQRRAEQPRSERVRKNSARTRLELGLEIGLRRLLLGQGLGVRRAL